MPIFVISRKQGNLKGVVLLLHTTKTVRAVFVSVGLQAGRYATVVGQVLIVTPRISPRPIFVKRVGLLGGLTIGHVKYLGFFS